MNSNELRQKFLEYFKTKGHTVLPSASLVPAETDPTVLFTTAGMQQFKRYYADPEAASATIVTTCQKCIRTGDIEEVGDNTHLTFFEMLGNFSFGYTNTPAGGENSYFKQEAIKYAWEFLTQELNVEKSRIYATYFKGERGVAEDRESHDILKGIDGLGKVEPQGFDDNFWSLGTENSPGGPTVEFYIDGIEIWNLVFNEYILKNGIYEPSQFKGVDTGMGLERLVCVINNAENVYHTDLFELPHKKLHELSKKEDSASERIILDHIKAASFIINDGVIPSNKDRGYVLRRIIRRAIVKGLQLGIESNFTTEITKEVFGTYQGIYFNCHPELDSGSRCKTILAELEQEEIKFRQTLTAGLKRLNSLKEIDGKTAFDLYQSYGLPLEVTIEEANRQRISINNTTIEQYNNFLREHQELSRTASAGMFKGGLAEAGEMTAKYHTATHLLLAALREVLGDHIFQKGSNITAERLRFDFSHPDKMTNDQIKKVEDIVNEKISADLAVEMKEMSLEDAKQCGAMGVFESKYGETVKVYSIGEFSKEMCGGPHATHTGELGHFKIAKEESSSSGVRRIKAVLG